METLHLDSFNTKNPLYQKLVEMGIPKSRTEQYKNFPIKEILAREYTFINSQYERMVEGERFVIKDGIVLEYPKNVKIMFDKSFEADSNHYDASYYMSHMLSPIIISIEVAEDSQFDIQHIFTKKQTFLTYRIVVKTRENTKVEVFESFETRMTQESSLFYGIDADIANDSTLVWIRDEYREKGECDIIGSHHYNAGKRAALELKTFDFGSANSLHLYKIDLADYAWTDANHLLLADKKARRGNVVYINHNAPYAKSVQEARSILKDKATGIFDAKICVSEEAIYSNAQQNSKAILLDENAHMYAKPQLEIYIDELEASHGSSIGRLDDEALFYLCSRGIHLDDAKKMLVLAFANRLIDTLSDVNEAQKIRRDFESVI